MNIETIKLNKSFDEFSLKDVSIKVPKGKIVGLIGENGAGKTTLIKCILGAMVKDSGEVKLFNKDYNDELKRDIGVVYDNSFMIETFNAKEINFILKNMYKNKWDEKLFYKYMMEFNIPLKKEIKKLSTGMKKKLEIAACLAHHPKVLILDEPTSGLDPVIRSEVLEIFKDFVHDENHSILLSTHITSDLEHIADEVIFVHSGEVIFDKDIKDVKNDYVLLETSKNDLKDINKKDILKYKKNILKYQVDNNADYQILINKKDMKDKYKKYFKRNATLDDIMLLYIKGEK